MELEKIYDVRIKRGMKFILTKGNERLGAKAGDIVKVTSVIGSADGRYNDYENIRVSNGTFSWRVSRGDLAKVDGGKGN